MTDIIILSSAKTQELYELTQEAVHSCNSTCTDKNILVIENNTERQYSGCETLNIFGGFNFNKYANIGAKLGASENIVIANNDLIFYDGWLDELLKSQHPVVSPKCPIESRQKDLLENTKGYVNGKHFSGWCFLIKRSLFEKIGGFDEDFHYICADNAVIEQVKKEGVTPMIVPSSKVKHIGGQTKDSKIMDALAIYQVRKFNKKYGKNLFSLGA